MKNNLLRFETVNLGAANVIIAPDGSEIQELLRMQSGSLAHCTLPPKKTSKAVVHKTIEEIWFCIHGKGEFWRKQNEKEKIVTVNPGLCLTIPKGTHFQFRNFGEESLRFIITTMPPWPGENEAIRVNDYWKF